MKCNVHNALSELGGDDDTLHVMREAVPTAADARLGRIMRIDRGWSTIRTPDPVVTEASRIVRVRNVEEADQVLFAPDTGYEVEIRGEEYLILRERDVHAVASGRDEGQTGLYL